MPAEEPEEIAGAPRRGGLADLRQTGFGPATLNPGIDTERLAETELEGEDSEAAPFGEEAGEPLAGERVFLNEVRALADRDDPRIPDQRAKRLEVVERCVGVERGEGALRA